MFSVKIRSRRPAAPGRRRCRAKGRRCKIRAQPRLVVPPRTAAWSRCCRNQEHNQDWLCHRKRRAQRAAPPQL